jgi:hypothetical protein
MFEKCFVVIFAISVAFGNVASIGLTSLGMTCPDPDWDMAIVPPVWMSNK